jgi:hypothetical protein
VGHCFPDVKFGLNTARQHFAMHPDGVRQKTQAS